MFCIRKVCSELFSNKYFDVYLTHSEVALFLCNGTICSLECRPWTMGPVLSWQYSETFLSFVQLFFVVVRLWGPQCAASQYALASMEHRCGEVPHCVGIPALQVRIGEFPCVSFISLLVCEDKRTTWSLPHSSRVLKPHD